MRVRAGFGLRAHRSCTPGELVSLRPQGDQDLRQCLHVRALSQAGGELLGPGGRELVILDTREGNPSWGLVLAQGHQAPDQGRPHALKEQPFPAWQQETPQSPQATDPCHPMSTLTPTPGGTPCLEAHVPGSLLPHHRCCYCTRCRKQRSGSMGIHAQPDPRPILQREKWAQSPGKATGASGSSFLAETSQIQIPAAGLAACVTFGQVA